MFPSVLLGKKDYTSALSLRNACQLISNRRYIYTSIAMLNYRIVFSTYIVVKPVKHSVLESRCNILLFVVALVYC